MDPWSSVLDSRVAVLFAWIIGLLVVSVPVATGAVLWRAVVTGEGHLWVLGSIGGLFTLAMVGAALSVWWWVVKEDRPKW